MGINHLLTAARLVLPIIILFSIFSYNRIPPSPEGPAGDQHSRTTHLSPVKPLASNSAMSSSIRRAAPLVFPAVSRHTGTVFFLHGLGDTGAGWADAVEYWRSRHRLDEIKFILPHAPAIPITMNHGLTMPGWFDIKDLGSGGSVESRTESEDAHGILKSRTYCHSLIQEEVAAGTPHNRIVLGGFSQGGALSILAGLSAPVKVAGVVGLSSWLPLGRTFKDHIPEGNLNKATPIFMGHGDEDPLVQYELAKASENALKDMGYDVTLKTYKGMKHSACLDELNEVEAFIEARLPAKGN